MAKRPDRADLNCVNEETKSRAFIVAISILLFSCGSGEERIPTVDDVMASLGKASIAIRSPEWMLLNESKEVEVLLSPSFTVRELQDSLAEVGQIEGAIIRYAGRMIAEVRRTDFMVEPTGRQEQAISEEGVTRWEWSIKPKTSGILKINLAIYAMLTINDQPTQRIVRAFDRTIEVRVRISDLPSQYPVVTQSFIAILAGFFGALFGALIGFIVGKKKRSSANAA